MVKSRCKADDCNAANPEIVTFDIEKLPKKAKEMIGKLKVAHPEAEQCVYCGTVWIS